jgi:Ca-activated chloride channel family protein
MRSAGWFSVVVVATLLSLDATGAARGRENQDPQRPVFRSSAAAVAVDVAVRNRAGRPVAGLTIDDFQLLDNGVAQEIDTISYGKLPIDVTIGLDVSHSVTGTMLDRLRRAVTQLMRDLQKEDRLKLMLFNQRIARVVDFTNDVTAVEAAIRNVRAGGSTALRDAMSVALVSAAEPDRRQLVVFFTDGSNSSSTTSDDVLMTVAQRTRATLAFVVPGPTTSRTVITSSMPGVPSITTSMTRPDSYPPLLRRLAAETGGRVLPVGGQVDLGAAFRRVLGDFRTTYVLYYTPRGVETGGYHTIEVKTKSEGTQVQARRGYFGS